jgi:hypothetical protein
MALPAVPRTLALETHVGDSQVYAIRADKGAFKKGQLELHAVV